MTGMSRPDKEAAKKQTTTLAKLKAWRERIYGEDTSKKEKKA